MTTVGTDTKTRFQGVFARHQATCPIGDTGRCRCKPSYYGVAYDRATKRRAKTKRMATADAATKARADLLTLLSRGEARPGGNLRLTEAREKFIQAARSGKALNKRGYHYKPRAIDDVEEVLKVHVEPRLGTRRITSIRRGDIQAIIDDLGPTLSGSRVRSIANGVRSLYRWAQDRDPGGARPPAGDERDTRVRPKVASVLMGHSTPERQPGAAAITLARYTHALPEDIERARQQLSD
jgi:hypothetical protein